MPATTIRGAQVLDGTIQRHDLDVSTVGQAVVAKVVQGSNISLNSTGGDTGTGDVTVSAPLATATTAGAVPTPPNNTASYFRGDATFADLTAAIQPTITSVRLRSFNAAANPGFSVDQRNIYGTLTNPANNAFIQDRWWLNKVGTMTVNTQAAIPSAGGEIVVPGTNFMITDHFLNVTLTAQEASLGVNDYLAVNQWIEGPSFRELYKDVHSVSLLVRTSLPTLKFGLTISDAGPVTKSLTKLCTISGANTWQLIPLPNLPVFPSGNFSVAPGTATQIIKIVLGAGSSATAPANDTWQSGATFYGAVGQDNFAAQAVNSTFQVAFVQWEPGSQCTTLIDKPFSAAYDEALRFYCKSYDYDVLPGTVSANGIHAFFQSGTTAINGAARFPKPMAKVPTLTGYNHSTGATNSIRFSNGTDYAITNFGTIGKGGIYVVNTATLPAVTAGAFGFFHFTADTGW